MVLHVDKMERRGRKRVEGGVQCVVLYTRMFLTGTEVRRQAGLALVRRTGALSQKGHKAEVQEKASVQARAVTALHAPQDKCAACFVRFACASECTCAVHTRMQVLYPHASASKCACAVHAHKCKQVHKCICLCICMYTCICMCRHRHASACFGTAITAHRRDAVFTFAPWPHKTSQL